MKKKKTIIKIRLLFDHAGGSFLLSLLQNANYGLFESVIGMVLALASNPPKRVANFASETSATPSLLILVRKALHLVRKLIPSSFTSSRKGWRYHRPFSFTRPPFENGSDQDFFCSRQLNDFYH